MNNTPLPPDKKLKVIFRVESGCLGPNGDSHVQSFCRFAQTAIEPTDANIIHWQICPRDNKALPEIQYLVGDKILKPDQATKYLQLFGKRLPDFEDALEDRIATLIGQYQSQLP